VSRQRSDNGLARGNRIRRRLARRLIRGHAKPQAMARLAFSPGQGSLALWSASHPPGPLHSVT